MRRLRALVVVVVAVVAGATLTGCPGAHDAYPSSACATDNDCYSGERCMNAMVCVPVSTPVDMAAPTPVADMVEPLPGGDS
jgi:hypothetical protein